jgi:quercetin dioxygenase-like cupin family protein
VISPGQTNPEHLHKLKEESFYCLYGEVRLEIESEVLTLKPGDLALIPAGKKHTIYSSTGAVVEEISSASLVSDSFYTDPTITENKFRKSNIVLWN